MLIEFKEEYLSIKGFETINLPDFTVIIGKNGSGKTHFLEAINIKNILVEDIQNTKLFKYNDFNVGGGLGDSEYLRRQDRSSEISYDSQWGIFQDFYRDNEKVLKTLDEEIRKIIGENPPHSPYIFVNDINYYDELSKIIDKRSHTPSRCDLPQDTRLNLHSTIKYSGKYITELTKQDWDKFSGASVEYSLGLNIAKMTTDYIQFVLLNEDTGIIREEPWVKFSRILTEFGLNLQITEPPTELSDLKNLVRYSSKTYTPKLVRDGKFIEIENLSSGEKTLFALAITVFQCEFRNFPQLLLLDEIDTFLYPGMIKHLMEVIKAVFIKKGCKVIIVTHSPTTCALIDDEDCFFEIQSSKKLEKITKTESVNMLSDGYMTLEEGLKIFDEACKKKLTIFSEGKNVKHISHALKILETNLEEVEIYEYEKNHAGGMGSSDIYGLFGMFQRFTLKNHVLFIWDCEVGEKVEKMDCTDNVHKYYFPKNTDNKLVKKGIENLYSQELTQAFLDIYKSEYLKEELKKPFEDYIKTLNDKDVFKNYRDLEDKIQEILKK